ncbi:hypothetical protein ACHHYP_05713 [Achlya hypogyna]|uniref:Uncharacterized protein n=1 Tax=Achlya hypogyna TaxID=1202772 RepID=A0A1V9YWT8_ACHHY|nr:hypothetical protein ACHHYP_05713 [Achlya hypogyna]
MSLGFLTESALVPSKAKAIKIDSKSLVDLKALVFREQERKKADIDALGLRSKRGARAKESGKKESNAGIEKRRQRDEEAEELLGDDERAKKKRSRAALIEKAKLYDQIARGERPASGAHLINFDEKTAHRDHEFNEAPVLNPEGDDMVEIVDEFGRTKRVHKRDVPQLVEAKATGSFVVSQWEKTLNIEEKGYLNQVHAEVQHAKLTLADKKRQKEERRERLKQALQHKTTPATTETVTPEASRAASEFLSSLL